MVTDVEGIRRSLLAEGSPTRALMCLSEGRPIGYAVYFYSYSTWLGRNGIYLEDPHVTPEYRGVGAGRRLLRELAREAVANDCGRLEWSVLDWNQPAIDFYRSIGALPQDEGCATGWMARRCARWRRSWRQAGVDAGECVGGRGE